MIRKKICMVGTSAVGKTSLVERYVKNHFSDGYLTTVGVKISRKQVTVGEDRVDLLLWDLNGEDRFQKLSMNYLRGAAGYFLVADGTRPDTLDAALTLYHKAEAQLGAVPFILLINKADLAAEWEIDDQHLEEIRHRNWTVLETSAKTGTGVEEAFVSLAERIVGVGDVG